MKKNTAGIALALSVLSLICAAACLALLLTGGGDKQPTPEISTQYVMYVGTNDKDTYQLEMTREEAREIVDTVCLKYFEGYTLQEATGAWTDETNEITHEYTLVCYFDGADKATVYQAADEIIRALNQNTVLIEEDQISLEYYGG